MSIEAVVIPRQLQQYINQCLDDAELKSLKAIPVKIFGYAVNLREYYDFERREFRQFKSQTITVTDIQELTEQEIAQYKKERENKLYKYYPALPSQGHAVTMAPAVSSAAAVAAAASVTDIPDYQPLVEILRRERQESRIKAAAVSAQPSTTAIALNPLSSADTTESTINSQPPLPANTRIKLHRQADSAQTTPSEKQQPASTHFFRRNSSASSSTTNINPSAPRTDDHTPLLRKSRTTKKL